jgi:hypothetical protein
MAQQGLTEVTPTTLYPFTTDHCSGGMTKFWNLCFKCDPPWNDCCIEHDLAYWQGGTAASRKKADLKLWKDVYTMGHPIWADLMYLAVRVGGHPALPFGWKWGYGWVKRGWGWGCARKYGKDML